MLETELILVVDDLPANLEVVTDALSDAGYEVAIATDGERAIAQAQLSLPSLILLDVMMPGIDGFETCRRLKAIEATRDIPIIFMTALSDATDKVLGFNLGAADYITKPFHELEVIARIKAHVKARQLNQELEQRVAERTAELSQALAKLQQSQIQLVQQEKMSALGNLVAGVAHEINNPLGFIFGNLQPAHTYILDLFHLLACYQQDYPNPTERIQQTIEDIDLTYLQADLPKLILSMKNGVERIRGISDSLRTFSRADHESRTSLDLHEGLDSTLLILKHRLKGSEQRPEIEIVKKYSSLPLLECFPGQLNQVFMNVLANAIDMFDEVAQQSSFAELAANPQTITIQTSLVEQESVEIQIQDNGRGIPEAVKARIFEDFFTTKPVGKGTGLGLAIARQIIEEKHQGSINIRSEIGQGTTFTLCLPLHSSSSFNGSNP